MTVLVVEDDEAVRTAIVDALADEDIMVIEACNGAEALQALGCAEVDYILLDLLMAVMNGLEFRHAQLADGRYADIPVIVMSASRDLEAIRATNPLAVVSKPLVVGTLMDYLRTVS